MAQRPSAWASRSSRHSRTFSPWFWVAKSTMVVVPPQAAARVPVSKSSEDRVPMIGISIWVWTSTPPGTTSLSEASMTSAAASAAAAMSLPGRSTASTRSPSISTSAGSAPVADTTVPPLISVAISASSCGVPVSGLSGDGTSRRPRQRSASVRDRR